MTYKEISKEELFWGEWFREDRLDKVMWAAAFVWAGVLILANNLGYLDGQGWSLFFRGAGALVLVELAIRVLVPQHRRDLLGTFVLAAFLLWLGGSALLWPIILVMVGASIMLRSISPSGEQRSQLC
jgi:hypothetical protein